MFRRSEDRLRFKSIIPKRADARHRLPFPSSGYNDNRGRTDRCGGGDDVDLVGYGLPPQDPRYGALSTDDGWDQIDQTILSVNRKPSKFLISE